ncbi:winged helix-turn-helix domain-containing protein [[Mycoplasma] collis]|uniref:winged helix-turn-helix domain-containing protein n=1 Tax=[Mycoplasma] collis TaxID=2127 RepID=UPI00051C83FB|nr:GntR family transcriptional regulator [[Mycoplasma] collis]
METKKEKLLKYLIDLIINKQKKPNEIMPSEQWLMLRFDVSRITAINAYKKLEAIGAVYNIPKQGRFVAENFFGLIKPFAHAYVINNFEIKKIAKKKPKWFEEFKIIFNDDYNVYQKKYFKDDEYIIFSENYVTKKYEMPKKFDNNFSFTNFFQEKNDFLKSAVYKLRYEKVNIFNCKYLVVVYCWYYDNNGIVWASKFIVKPKYFIFSHQEKSLF